MLLYIFSEKNKKWLEDTNGYTVYISCHIKVIICEEIIPVFLFNGTVSLVGFID
jgi:hypothetical protein